MIKKTSLSLLFISVILFYTGCSDLSNEITPVVTKEYISSEEDPYMSDFKRALGDKNSRQSQDVNWEDIFKVQNPNSGVTTYTLFKQSTPGAFENLVVMTDGQEQDAYIIKYIPDAEWLANNSIKENIKTFTGRVEFLTFEEEYISGLDYENGLSELEQYKDGNGNGRVEDCETVYEIHWTESCAEGGDCVGGDTIIIYEWQVCEPYSGSYVTLDAGPDGNTGGSGGGSVSTGGGDPGLNLESPDKCPEGSIKDDGGMCINAAEYWESQIDDSQVDPCISDVLAMLKGLQNGPGNVVSNVFSYFDLDIDGFDWVIKNGSPNDPNAAAGTNPYNRSTGKVVTVFNMNKFQMATDLSVARTLIHEAIHANINAFFVSDPLLARNMYPQLVRAFNLSSTTPDINALHHDQMISFVGFISDALKEYGNGIKGYGLSDSFYDKLAWGGLTDTETFKGFSQSTKNDIRNIIKIEQSGKDINNIKKTQKGDDAGC